MPTKSDGWDSVCDPFQDSVSVAIKLLLSLKP